MAKRRPPNPHRLGGKRPEDSPLVRFCKAFTSNYSMLLRVAFIVGILGIIDPLLTRIETVAKVAGENPAPAVENVPAAMEPAPPQPESLPTIRELDEGWKHHHRCVSDKGYRDAHFDACFPDGTVVYEQPKADEDDGSFLLFLDKDSLYAIR